MSRLTDTQLMEAVEAAAREDTFGFTSIRADSTDAEAAAAGGGRTPRIAIILDRPLPTVRRRLFALHEKGLLVRAGSSKSAYRWWPVGLVTRISSAISD